jgi:excisionase family DNA binding protein
MTFENLPDAVEQVLQEIHELNNNMLKVMGQINDPKNKIQTDQRFSVKELANYLNCSDVTISRYVKDNKVPYHRIDRTLYFLKSEIDMESSNKRTKFRIAC